MSRRNKHDEKIKRRIERKAKKMPGEVKLLNVSASDVDPRARYYPYAIERRTTRNGKEYYIGRGRWIWK